MINYNTRVDTVINILTDNITLSKIERRTLRQFVNEWIDDSYIDDEESFSIFIDRCWYNIINAARNNTFLSKITKLHNVSQRKHSIEQDFK